MTLHAPSAGSRPVAAEAVADRLRARGLELGFVRVGFCGVERLDAAGSALEGWRTRGRAAGMDYLHAPQERADARVLLPAARSMVVVALPVGALPPLTPPGAPALATAIARYAQGDDYHHVLKGRLRALADTCADLVGREVRARACVDTAPLLERAAAARSGTGFLGKSTLLIVPGVGPQVLLGELLLDVELPPDLPMGPRCGRCRACLDACPTGAFVGPYELDAGRCISYLTIELAGPIPRELRAGVGVRVFGCDVCQDVCPFDRARQRQAPGGTAVTLEALVALLEIGASAYRRLVRGRALARTHRAKLASNAAVALGNLGDARAVPPLARALAQSSSPLVRIHAAWALGRLGGDLARDALELARHDADAAVVQEVGLSLAELHAKARRAGEA